VEVVLDIAQLLLYLDVELGIPQLLLEVRLVNIHLPVSPPSRSPISRSYSSWPPPCSGSYCSASPRKCSPPSKNSTASDAGSCHGAS